MDAFWSTYYRMYIAFNINLLHISKIQLVVSNLKCQIFILTR